MLLNTTQCVEAVRANDRPSHKPFEPDADIAGIGVIASFLVSAYLVLLFAAVSYFSRLVDPKLLNALDSSLLKFLRVRNTPKAESQAACQKACLAFSDTQIVTGISILIAGFAQIRDISVYHFNIVAYMGWLASNVHLTTLTVLEQALRENPNNRHLRTVRLVFMVTLLVLLIAAMVPTTAATWGEAIWEQGDFASFGPSMNAVCFFSTNQDIRGGIDADGVWSYILIVLTYVWKISLLFKGPAGYATNSRRRIESRMRRGMQSLKAHDKTLWLYIQQSALWCTFLFMHAVMEFLGSFLLSLWVLLLGLAWGSVKILETRSLIISPKYLGNDPALQRAEDKWQFGQIAPLVLLAMPFLQMVEAYTDMLNDRHQEKKHTDKRLSHVDLRSPVVTSLEDYLSAPDLTDEISRGFSDWLYQSVFYRMTHMWFNFTVCVGAVIFLFFAGAEEPGYDFDGYPRSRDVGFIIAAFSGFMVIWMPVGLCFSDRLRINPEQRGLGHRLRLKIKRPSGSGKSASKPDDIEKGPPRIGTLAGLGGSTAYDPKTTYTGSEPGSFFIATASDEDMKSDNKSTSPAPSRWVSDDRLGTYQRVQTQQQH